MYLSGVPTPTRTGYAFDGWYTDTIYATKGGQARMDYLDNDTIQVKAVPYRWYKFLNWQIAGGEVLSSYTTREATIPASTLQSKTSLANFTAI